MIMTMSNTAWMGRTELLFEKEGMERIMNANILVVGLGGVGSFAAEMIARAGVGMMTIIDGDVVDPTNRNRQLPALSTTHGMKKSDVMRERLLAINPELNLTALDVFVRNDITDSILDGVDGKGYDYVLDCIDTLSPKINLIRKCVERNIRIVSSMGAAGKVDPTQVQIADISKTYNCTLARYVKKKLRRMNIRKGVKVVFTTELPDRESLVLTEGMNNKRSFMGTVPYLPAIFGCTMSSVVIRGLVAGEHLTSLRSEIELSQNQDSQDNEEDADLDNQNNDSTNER